MPRRKGAGLWDELKARLPGAKAREEQARAANAAADAANADANPYGTPKYATLPSARSAPPSPSSSAFVTGRPAFSFAGRRKTLRKAFDRCVKSVRKTVKTRKGSTKESAAIAICTKSVLQTRGRTLKRYRKGRLTTQRKRRGGNGVVKDWATGEDVTPKGNASDMPLDKVYPQKKEGTFSMPNPMVRARTQSAIKKAVAEGADPQAARFVAEGNEEKYMNPGEQGNRGFHTLTVNGEDTKVTGRARRTTRSTRRRKH